MPNNGHQGDTNDTYCWYRAAKRGGFESEQVVGMGGGFHWNTKFADRLRLIGLQDLMRY